MKPPLAVLAAGGTGGHMFPAQALAEELLRRGWRVALASDERGLRYAAGFPEAVQRHKLRAATTARGGITAKLATPVTLGRGLLEALMWFRRDRPSAVIGFGGYPAFPAMAAAVAMGIPRLIHEQNGVLGKANQMFAKRVHSVAAGMGRPVNAPDGVQIIETGNPIRDAARAAMSVPHAPPEPGGEIRLLIFGGSQGASVFSDLLPPALSFLPDAMRPRISVVQQARDSEIEKLRIEYAAADVARVEAAPFFADMPDRIAAAHLVIARAGASSCAEIAAIGRPSVLVPLPSAAADHQTANARWLEAGGGAILAPQDTLTPESLAAQLALLLADPPRLSKMAAAAREAGKPQAAEALADLVESIAPPV